MLSCCYGHRQQKLSSSHIMTRFQVARTNIIYVTADSSAKRRSTSYRLGLRPGSVRLRPRALDLRFSRALAAGLVPRPRPGLSPRARSRGRAPTPCASAPNWADFAEMPQFYSLLEKIFMVLLSLRGDVSVLLAAREINICGA